MKKVRLNLKRGIKSWSFTLYDSAESAFYLKSEPEYDDRLEEDYRKVITMKAGGLLEVEWLGSEWVYDDDFSDFFSRSFSSIENSYEKYDKIRVGKMSPTKGTTQKLGYLEVFSGWVLGGSIPWVNDDSQSKVRITEIKGKIHSRLDFSDLLKGAPSDSDFIETDEENDEKIDTSYILS